MYRVMLADDEGIVRDSLRMIIEKNFPGKCEIELARTGRDVIELAEIFRPDIVFMDIQMPGINGIEAIREIKRTNVSAEFIVLSAYDKFDYAKEAVNLGVLEYMTKPFDKISICEVMRRAIERIDSRRKKRSQDLFIREKMESVTPIIENGFIYATMFNEYAQEDVDNYKNLLELTSDYGCMLAFVMGDDQQGRQMTNAVGASVRMQKNYQKFRELLKEQWSCVVGAVISNKVPVFLPCEMKQVSYEQRIEMIDTCRALARRLKKEIDISFRIGIGSIHRLMDSMSSYEEALKALENSTGSVAHVDDLPIQCRYDDEYRLDLENELFDRLRDGTPEECARAAGHYFDWMVENYTDKAESIRLKILEFVLFAEHDTYLSGGMTYHFDERADYLDTIMHTQEVRALREWFVEKFRTANRNMHTKKNEHENSLVERAKGYIQENYKRDLSLDELSKELDISPYYFSKLFKEEAGSNFIEYLTTLRISKAKEMLRDPSHSMKEICAQVGYSDPNYFSRIFKKNVGYTPTEYREREKA